MAPPTPVQPTVSYLTQTQIDALLQDLAPHRVAKMQGNLSHLEGWDIRSHLNRVLGFARWSCDLTDLTMIYETQVGATGSDRPKWTCAYRATVRLAIHAPDGTLLATYTEAATGSPMGPMPDREQAHDMAIKTAETQALKRCAVNLGTRFGLSLYRDGDLHDVVIATLVAGAEPPAVGTIVETTPRKRAAKPQPAFPRERPEGETP